MSGIIQGLLASFSAAAALREIYSWGRAYYGVTGLNKTSPNDYTPVKIGALTNWYEASSGNTHTLALKADGTLWSWGNNIAGKLGDSTYNPRSSPIQVGALTTWYKAAAGEQFSGAIKTDGTLWTWGRGNYGNLGHNDTVTKPSPVQVGALTTWEYIFAGQDSNAAIKTDGTLWTWGQNSYGNLGDNSVNNRSSPIQVGALTNWAHVAHSRESVIAVKTDGTLWYWGFGSNGSNGSGSTTNLPRSSPIQIGALTNWVKASGGQSVFNAIKTDGTLWGWGLNSQYGEVGNNSLTNVGSPVQVGALTTWTDIAVRAGGNELCHAIRANGTLWGWGRAIFGGIGDGSATDRSSPVQVGAGRTWVQVTSSQLFSIGHVEL
jgi:alpha-tubulin suppressor-like RCC1 family protein